MLKEIMELKTKSKEYGLSMTKIANAINVSSSTVKRIFDGTHMPKLNIYLDIKHYIENGTK